MIRRTIRFSLLLLAAGTSPINAQTDSVRGRLVGEAGEPIADERVLLHRVVGTSGANIAEARTDADGRFVITVDDADDPEAVYFLAARWQGELYIGEAFRAPFDTTDHLLQVGVPGTSASALLDGTAPPTAGMLPQSTGGSPATGTSWILFAIPAVALLGVLAYYLLRARTASSPRRRLLREIAELDLAHAHGTAADYPAARAALIERLRDTPA